MAYDERLADRVRDLLGSQVEAEKKMFGGLAFMVEGRMACCVSGRGLLVKTGHDAHPELVALDHVEPMKMRDAVSDSWVRVGAEALIDDGALHLWIGRGLAANPPQRRT